MKPCKFDSFFSLQIEKQFDQDEASGIAIACYLAKVGANLQYHNHKGKTPFDVLDNPKVTHLLLHFSERQEKPT